MESVLNEIEEFLTEMEEIVEKDELCYEDEERLQELYVEVSNGFEDYELYPIDESRAESNDRKFRALKKRFKKVCQEFETPDELNDAAWEMMFPND